MGKFTFNKISSAVLNLLCAALEVPAALTVLSKNGLSAFEFFTNDSNFFAFFACLIMGVSQIKSLAGMVEIPRWVKAVKYAAVCCMTLMAVVAACVLVPMQGGASAIRPMLISYPMIFHHVICPILCLASFLFFERSPKIGKRSVLLGTAPVLLYAAAAITLNLTGKMKGPYPFLMIKQNPAAISAAWFVGIIGGAFLLSLLLWKLNFGKKQDKIR